MKRKQSTVKKISPEEASSIIETERPLGRYYLPKLGMNGYVGIDNSTGDAWVEEFCSLNACRIWLLSG